MKLELVLEREEEDGTYSVHCPALQGCQSQDETRGGALKNIQEAIQLYGSSLFHVGRCGYVAAK